MKFCQKCQSYTDRYAHGSCKPCVRARSLAYVPANPEKAKAKRAAWVKTNFEKNKVRISAWHAANRDKVKASTAAWQKLNPEVRRIHSNNRRARTIAAGGKLSQGLALKLFALQRGKCACCNQALGKNYHLDHIMPLALGGSNTDGNMQLLMQRCNNQKSAKHPVDFMQSRGFLL